jgi:hypothetical protein
MITSPGMKGVLTCGFGVSVAESVALRVRDLESPNCRSGPILPSAGVSVSGQRHESGCYSGASGRLATRAWGRIRRHWPVSLDTLCLIHPNRSERD